MSRTFLVAGLCWSVERTPPIGFRATLDGDALPESSPPRLRFESSDGECRVCVARDTRPLAVWTDEELRTAWARSREP